jgi:hypothetical protein
MSTDVSRADNERRAPVRHRFEATTRPLIVTLTFVSRVDDTAVIRLALLSNSLCCNAAWPLYVSRHGDFMETSL